MYKDFFGLYNADCSWNEFINEHENFLNNTAEQLSKIKNFTPEPKKILRLFNVPADKIKVVILGQDPYPQKGAASGRAFEFCLIDDWMQTFSQVSLKNILRAIYMSKTGKILKWTQLRNEIGNKNFEIAPPKKLFESWEKQGVLCLNGSLTCLTGKPDSHKAMWEEFCRGLVKYIDAKNPSAYWFLWGNRARTLGKTTLNLSESPAENGKRIFTSRHPMLCGTDAPDDFLKCKCFEETGGIIDWCGLV